MQGCKLPSCQSSLSVTVFASLMFKFPGYLMLPHFRNTISENVHGNRGAILTTHSMEEADALCSRVGIMVKGQLK